MARWRVGRPRQRELEVGTTLRLHLRITGTTYHRARRRVSLADLAAKARDAAQPLAVSRGSVRMRPSLPGAIALAALSHARGEGACNVSSGFLTKTLQCRVESDLRRE